MENNQKTLKALVYKSFEFHASTFEIYENGKCIKSGDCKMLIKSTATNNEIYFQIFNNDCTYIENNFSFTFCNDDLLPDRIQYGRLPYGLNIGSSTLPVVCNIFPDKNIIRFATLSPLKLIEFKGTIL